MPPTSGATRHGHENDPRRRASGDARGGGRSSAARTHLLELLTPVVAATGYDLDDVTVTAAGRRSLVRVVVDGDDGVDLDAVADVSRAVSETLDATDADGFSGPYVLEVSSPGVDRPLREPRHWRRAVGRLVQVPAAGSPTTGRVVAATENTVTLDVDGTPREFALGELGPGRVQVEFNHRASGDDEVDEIDEDEIDEDEIDEDETAEIDEDEGSA